jgi:hypothetical protein
MIALVQSLSLTAGVTDTASGTFSANVTAGNLVVVGVGGLGQFDTGEWSTDGVTDNLGNTYVRYVVTTPQPSAWSAAIFASIITTGGSCTITATHVSAFPVGAWGCAAEFSGIAAVSPFDVGAEGESTSGTRNTGDLTALTAQNEELEFAFTICNLTETLAVDSFTPSYAVIAQRLVGSAFDGEGDYRILSSPTDEGCTWTAVPAFDWRAVAATFKAAAAGTRKFLLVRP